MISRTMEVKMQPVRVVLLLVALFLGYNGVKPYVFPKPKPDPKPVPNVVVPTPNPVVITIKQEEFPPKPTNQQLISDLAPLSELMKNEPMDALDLARFYRWGAKIVKDSKEIDNLTGFNKVQLKALKVVFADTPMAGKYQGTVDAVLEQAYKKQMSFLKNGDGTVISLEMTDEARKAIVEFLNAASWKFREINLENLPG